MTLSELRAEVQCLRDTQYDLAVALEDDSAVLAAQRAFGRAEAFDEVLGFIDSAVAS